MLFFLYIYTFCFRGHRRDLGLVFHPIRGRPLADPPSTHPRQGPIKGASPPLGRKTSIRINNSISLRAKHCGHMVSKGASFHHNVIIRPADCCHSSAETHSQSRETAVSLPGVGSISGAISLLLFLSLSVCPSLPLSPLPAPLQKKKK